MQNDKPEQHRPSRRRRWRRPLVAIALAALAAIVLAACGSSGTSTSSSTSNSAATTAAGGSKPGARFAAVRKCLEKEGIKLPSRPSGGASGSAGQPGSGPPARGGFKLPEGVSRARFQEAIKKCGGSAFAGGRRRFDSAAARAGLTKFAACMRENGVNVPAPNTSGKGPVFDTKGIDTSSAAFKKAQQKCRSNLTGVFGGAARPPGGAPPAGGAGAPPAEGGA